jgi:hypothetical protein
MQSVIFLENVLKENGSTMYSSTMDEKMHSERMDEWEAKRQVQRVPTQAKRTHTQKNNSK